ncbi:hypothetical protein GCK32_016417 [Trichostrongylus colubriformis]|uniref:Uncharacterized protein n=1 Tax=Trichostrongylus colubriformis TaxID=6319 RepID=A0AAN8FWB8_TRICO
MKPQWRSINESRNSIHSRIGLFFLYCIVPYVTNDIAYELYILPAGYMLPHMTVTATQYLRPRRLHVAIPPSESRTPTYFPGRKVKVTVRNSRDEVIKYEEREEHLTETATTNALPKKKKKKAKAADSSKFVRNTMDNVPTIT